MQPEIEQIILNYLIYKLSTLCPYNPDAWGIRIWQNVCVCVHVYISC